jgi:HEAT repeat protein
MKHSVIVGTVLGILAASTGLQAQDGNWVETKFHRIHLLNGNFIDGHLIGESDRALTMKVGGGEMQIRKDLIERNPRGVLKVEYVKMRSYKEAPKIEPLRLTKPSSSPEISATPTAKPPGRNTPTEAVTLTGPVADQLAQAGDILKSGTLARKKGAIEALATLGAEAATFIASQFASFEDDLLPTAVATLMGIKESSILSTIRPLTTSDRPRLREQAAVLVGTLGGGREDSDALRVLLKDQDTGARGAAIIGLRRLNDYDAFDLIADSLADPDPGIRSKSLLTLTQFAQHGGLSQKLADVLGRTLDQAQGDVRVELLKEAAQQGSKDLGPLMARLATDGDAMVRSYAIMGLGKINSNEYAELILERMKIERDYWPRIQLTGAAQALRLQKAIDPLIEWMGDDDSNIRAASARALRAITGVNPGADREAWEAWRKQQKGNQ